MKKFLSFYLSIIMLISLIVPSLANQNNALYKANEKLSYNEKNIATTLISYEGKDYIPIRVVANLLGLSVEWDGDTHTVYMDETTTAEPLIINNNDINKFITVKDQQRIHLVFKNMEISKIISDTGININGTETMIPIDTILYNNTTYVDISAFCSFFLRDYKDNKITDRNDELTLANEVLEIYKNRDKYKGYVLIKSNIPENVKAVEQYLSAYIKTTGYDNFRFSVFVRKDDKNSKKRYKINIDNTV